MKVENEEVIEKKDKKRIYILLFLLLLLVILPFLIYYFFVKYIYVKDFQDSITISLNEPFQMEEMKACYGNFFTCTPVSYEYIGEEVDTSKIAEYEGKYRFTYHEKVKELTQIIKVVDQEPPTLEFSKEEVIVCPNGTISEQIATSTDAYDGDLTDQITYQVLEEEVEYAIKDSSGNENKKTVPARIEDTVAPTIELKGNQTYYIKVNEEFTDPGYTASDQCDGDLTAEVEVENTINTKSPGEYYLKYSVKDHSNNQTTIIRTIYVYQESNQSNTGKNIYLTFDDGPSIYTDTLLNVLKKYNVKATFFVTNNGPDSAIIRAYNEGHTIAIHTATHNYRTIYASEDAFFSDIQSVRNRIKNLTGYETNMLRFPGGSSNTVSSFNPGIMSRLTKQVEAQGYHYFDWNVDSNDAGGATTKETVANNVIKSLGSGSTYVVLQHDIKKYSVDAVETIIQYGLSHGYTFQALTMTSPVVHHRVNN